ILLFCIGCFRSSSLASKHTHDSAKLLAKHWIDFLFTCASTHTHTQTDTHTHRHTHTHTHTYTHTQRERETHRHRHTHTHINTHQPMLTNLSRCQSGSNTVRNK